MVEDEWMNCPTCGIPAFVQFNYTTCLSVVRNTQVPCKECGNDEVQLTDITCPDGCIIDSNTFQGMNT